MKPLYFSLFFFFLSVLNAGGFDQAEVLMQKSDCLACHKENQKLIGPSFKEMADKYELNSNNIKSLIQSVREGSSGKWGDMPMPPHPTLSETEVKKIIEGILSLRAASEGEEIDPREGGNLSDEDIQTGADFFQGKIRFAHGGPSCIACHHVKNDAIIGGGILAKDLTTVFSRLGGEGVRIILGGPPFPVMQQAYKDKPLEDDEVRTLVAFLQSADQQHMYQKPKDYGLGLLLSGVFGATLFFIFIALYGYRRKKVSVNQEIYDRQIKSE
ncbi:MAG: hypothetical protein HYW47_05150 [Deltaproteobacteria bacterium]|nr:hypothetical protein [Deltaproteobacteria bacterium]